MAKRMLVSTLGTSPAVVTEAIDLLTRENQRPDGILLLHTQDSDVVASLDLLTEHLPTHCRITYIVPVPIGSYGDIDSAEAAVAFMAEACAQLKTWRDARYEVLVSIAGGRKVMSALMSLAVQFYGAQRLFHVWVPPWMEEEGEIGKLRRLADTHPEKLNDRLHPTLDTRDEADRPHLVDLPFIGLYPLLPEILRGLQGGEPSKPVKELLVANGLLFRTGGATQLGDGVAQVLASVESLPPPREGECPINIRDDHGKDKLKEFAPRLAQRFLFISRIDSIAYGEEEVSAQPPAAIVVHTRKLRTPMGLGLKLSTTAASEGQLEAARRAVRAFMDAQ